MDSDRTGQDWTSELRPDDGADPDWPDDWPESGRLPAAGIGSAPRGPRGLALGLTAAVAICAGAGAVYLYKSELAAPASAAAASSPSLPAGGAEESVMMLGQVLAVGHGSVTVGGGPGPAISAQATSATKFAGTVRSLAQVRVGDTVTAEITVSGGVATLIRLQDPASQS